MRLCSLVQDFVYHKKKDRLQSDILKLVQSKDHRLFLSNQVDVAQSNNHSKPAYHQRIVTYLGMVLEESEKKLDRASIIDEIRPFHKTLLREHASSQL